MRKIIFTAITLTLWLHATPVTLNNEGLITGLEKFKPICEYYGDIIKDSHKVKRLCGKYNKRLNNVLQAGYRMDKYIVPTTHTHMYQGKMHTCTNQTYKPTKYDTKLLNRYRSDVFSLDKLREEIIEYAGREKYNARRHYDAEYHEKLIRKDIVALYPGDEIFIAEHREIYAKANNPRYIELVKKNAEILWSKKQIMIVAKIKQEDDAKRRKEHEEWMEKCGLTMTAKMHYKGLSGKISGRVKSSQDSGYLLKSHVGSTFFVQGGTPYTVGEYVSNIYVTSKRERIGTTITDRRSGVKTQAGNVLVVDYNPWCEKY